MTGKQNISQDVYKRQDLVRILLGAQFQEQGLVDALKFGHDGLLRYVLALRRGLQVGDVRLPCGLIGADGPEHLQVCLLYTSRCV